MAQGFKAMYPKLPSLGDVEARPVRTSFQCDPNRYCLLYSYGVDATSSLLRNLQKKPSLLTVRGTLDLRLREDPYWARVQGSVRPFVQNLGLESHVVETNALDMVNLDAIEADFGRVLGGGWWQRLDIGLFLLSLAAPYSFINQTGKVIIASSHTRESQKPWGSSPMTDEKVRWAGVRVVHDSYDLERVDKIRRIIVPYRKESGLSVPLRVCIGEKARLASGGLNCGQCSKCMLVELTLIICGSDPSESGFDVSPGSIKALRSNLEKGKFNREVDPTAWDYVKQNAASSPGEVVSKHPGLREFLDWFANWDGRTVQRRRGYLDRLAPRGSKRRDMARVVLSKKVDPGESQSDR